MNEFISGSINGFVQNIVGHPLDTAKILIQNNQKLYHNPLYYYRGFWYPTIFNILSNGILFSFNHKLYHELYPSHYVSGFIVGGLISPIIFLFDIGKIKNQIRQNISIQDIYNTKGLSMTFYRESIALSFYLGSYYQLTEEYKLSSFFAGGISGLLNWTITYPSDTIKTRQMSMNISMLKAYQIGNLWNGYTICAIRSIIINSIGFTTYEYCKKYL